LALTAQSRTLLDQFAAAGLPATHTLTPAKAREMAAARRALYAPPSEPVAQVEDRSIPGPAGELPVRVYRPVAGGAPVPALVYFHGGGWVVGNLDSHDPGCRAVANHAGCAVVSVDYRLAPEARFPAAAEDAYAATRWVAEHADELGVDPARLAVGGDSAGGNLAAVVTLMARERGGPELAYQVLIYPVTDSACDTSSYEEFADGYMLTRADMLWYWDHYVGDQDRGQPYASPLRARDLRGLPPALVITAGFDPLRDEGESYAARLRDAGVPTILTRYDGVIHGFFGMIGTIDESRRAIDQVAHALRTRFAALVPASPADEGRPARPGPAGRC
jgi:acetyl esterase